MGRPTSLRGLIYDARSLLAHWVHPEAEYCSLCDDALIFGSCDRCGIGRLQMDYGPVVKCQECGAEWDIEMKMKA